MRHTVRTSIVKWSNLRHIDHVNIPFLLLRAQTAVISKPKLIWLEGKNLLQGPC